MAMVKYESPISAKILVWSAVLWAWVDPINETSVYQYNDADKDMQMGKMKL